MPTHLDVVNILPHIVSVVSRPTPVVRHAHSHTERQLALLTRRAPEPVATKSPKQEAAAHRGARWQLRIQVGSDAAELGGSAQLANTHTHTRTHTHTHTPVHSTKRRCAAQRPEQLWRGNGAAVLNPIRWLRFCPQCSATLCHCGPFLHGCGFSSS